jgi:hypothetical protein
VAASIVSERTLVVGIEVDRDESRLVAYTLKSRPYRAPEHEAEPRAHDDAESAQIEVSLLGPGGARHTRRVDAGPLCLVHSGDTEPHIAGDTIRLHRDAVVLELPEIAGFDRVEIAYHDRARGALERRSLGEARLDRAAFTAAAGPFDYADVKFAEPADDAAPPLPTAATVLWPESFGDDDIYTVFGDPTEGDRRINYVIVPDGYRYAEKALMEAHAAQTVAHFRAKTPHAEHDLFHNYILVYAYSQESGTDQCDCSIVVNSAMGTRFPNVTPQCGHSDNRCLHYGSGCDTNGTTNIVAAELRAPFHDETLVMVNTGRYGGCGGSRATFAAGSGAALELAVHEMGHSAAGLADEYGYQAGCGSTAGELNTSTNAVTGAWPEWIPELGPPREGAQYWTQCLYRPLDDCEMRNLDEPFCPVCNQRWSLFTFGHPRVAPTAPIESKSPAGPTVAAWVGVPVDFSVATRLSVGPNVTNALTWVLRPPGPSLPMIVATGTTAHTQVLDAPGLYKLSAEVIADTNFVKPAKYGANVDLAAWDVTATVLPLPPEVSGPAATTPLRFVDAVHLAWEDASAVYAFAYNLYRGSLSALPSGEYGACLQPGLPAPTAVDASLPLPGTGWFYLVAGSNPSGEGSLGASSAGVQRQVAVPCP